MNIQLSPYTLMENESITRYQAYLDTGEYPHGIFSKTWDMLAWIEAQRKVTK